jgi:hypothetical protein
MFLKKVRLVNFCQHIDRTIQFGQGLNVIVGPNGCGKSNILNSIYGCLTGDFGRNAGKAADNIAINRLANEPSMIDLSFSHGSTDMQLVRRLDPVDRKFVVGPNTYTADKEVADKLFDILEIDKDILNQYVFVEQWDHFGPLALAPAKRTAAFQKLFRIDQLTKIGEELSDGSIKLSSVSVATYDIASLTVQMEKLKTEIESAKALLADMCSLDSLDSALTENNSLLADWKRKQKLLNDVSTRKDTIARIVKEVTSYSEKITSLNEVLLTTHEEISNLQDKEESAKKIETAWVKYEYYLASKKAVETKFSELAAEQIKNTQPVKPEGYLESIDGLTKQLDAVKFKHEQHKQFLSSIDFNNESATCPTCGTLAKNLLDKWQQCKEESESLFEQIGSLSTLIATIAKYDKANAAYVIWFNGYQKRVAEATKTAENIVVEVEPDFSRKEASEILAVFKSLNDKLISTAKQISKIDADKSKLEGMESQLQAELVNDLEELSKYETVDEKSVETAQLNIAKLKEDKNLLNSLNTNLAVSKSELKAIEEKIAAAHNQIKLSEIHSGWNERIDNLKKVFKFNALPTVISYRYMDRVVVELNRTLSDIGVPFNIELEPDLSFVANFGSHKVPATRLSGGQKIMLTIAYRLAVNFTFATNLGLLCLDEPTVGLDDANLGALEKAFERLRQFSLANGVQIVVVTHEKGISHLFDHTIDLTQV